MIMFKSEQDESKLNLCLILRKVTKFLQIFSKLTIPAHTLYEIEV